VIINRHNYEEFFLLYVDNELNAEDRAAVERFVQHNADLAQEMAMLRESVLPNENVEFDQKELLYATSTGITIDNYEEYFVLAADKELDQHQKEEVESFVLKHPKLQNEFILIEQTRLQPETIIFEEKEKLYRKEEKERRVIFVNWMRISAAAAVVGLIAFAWIFTQNKSYPTANNYIVKRNEAAKSLPKKIEPAVKSFVQEKAVAIADKKETSNTQTETIVEVTKLTKSVIKRDDLAVTKLKAKPGKTMFLPDKVSKSVKDPEQKAAPLATTKGNKNNLPSVSENPLNTSFSTDHPNEHSREAGSSIATQAVYHEIDNQDDEDKNLYIGFIDINKNKLKGLFKKAATFFGKKADQNDGDRTLKIAGFEIKNK